MTPVAIHLPQPCAESWAAMPAAGPGRHCAACQCTVVDFSHMSEVEVLAYLAQASGKRVCGAFRPDQVQVPAGMLPAPASAWRRWAAAALALLGLRAAAPAVAQAQAGRTLGAPMAAPAQYPARMLRGQVLVAGTKEPLAKAAVLVEGLEQTVVYTDAQGRFQLSLPALPATTYLQVNSTTGRLRQTRVLLPAPGSAEPLIVQMQHVVVVGKPLPPRTR